MESSVLSLKRPCESVRFSPDGKLLGCTGSGRLAIWELASKARRHSLGVILPHLDSLDFSPTAPVVVVKNTVGNLAFVDVDQGLVIGKVLGRFGEGCAVFFSQCGGYVIDGTWNGLLLVRKVEDGGVVYCEEQDDAMICSMSLSADRTKFSYVVAPKWVSGRMPPPSYVVVREWPFSRESARTVFQSREILGAGISSGGSSLVVVHQPERSSFLEILNLEEGASTTGGRAALSIELGGGPDISWSADDRWVALAGNDMIVVLATDTSEVVWQRPHRYASAVSFCGSEPLLAVGGWQHGEVLDLRRLGLASP